jgi:hypothetical protein
MGCNRANFNVTLACNLIYVRVRIWIRGERVLGLFSVIFLFMSEYFSKLPNIKFGQNQSNGSESTRNEIPSSLIISSLRTCD